MWFDRLDSKLALETKTLNELLLSLDLFDIFYIIWID